MRTLIACLLMAVMVAGCSGQPKPAPSAQPDSLHVVRQSPLRVLPPLDKTLTDKATAQQLYADFQAMPEVAQANPRNCPEDNGVKLQLTFKTGDSVLIDATADASGCRVVKLSGGGARDGAGEPGQRFFADLARAVGLTPGALAGFTANTDLLAVQMAGGQIGWGLGAGKLYRTVDSGVTWMTVTPPGATLETGGAPGYSPAFFLGPDKGWVSATEQDHVAVFRTENGGRTWQKATVAVQSMGGTRLWFMDPDHGWLLVPGGAAMMHEAVALYHTADGGVTWTKVAETDPQAVQPGGIPFAGDKSGFAFIDANTGWLTGYTPVPGHVYLYVTHDGGKTWAEQPLTVPAALADHDMSSFPPVVLGPDVAVLPVSTGDGMLFYTTHDGGATWTPGATVVRAQHETSPVWDFADAAHGVVADGNRLWLTSDGGKAWTGGEPVAALQNVRQLELNAAGCWAVIGQQPPTRLLLSTDGCRTWTPQ